MKRLQKLLILLIPLVLLIPLLAFTLPSLAEEQNLSVSAVVPPNQNDFQFAFASDGQTTVPQNTTLGYTITYGAHASGGVTTATTIVADFSDDIAPGGSHVLDYVIGSASNGYGGAQPVVDLTNRTITWVIPALPAGTTNQTLTFQLRTNENYTGASAVSFTTRVSFSNTYTSLPDETVTQTYQFDADLVTPTPTQSPTPTLTPTPTIAPTTPPSPTATPTPIQSGPTPTTGTSAPSIIDVSFPQISDATAVIAVTTDRPARLQIQLGSAPNALTRTFSSNQYETVTNIPVADLSPETPYYFRIIVTGVDGRTRTSELFTFTTAKRSEQAAQSNDSLVITSAGTLIIAETITSTAQTPFGLLFTNTGYELQYTFGTTPIALAQLEVVVRSQDGIDRVVALQVSDGRAFATNLRSGSPGTYTLFLRLTDDFGNVREQKIAILKVLTPLSVKDGQTQLPIADARVLLSRFDPATKRFIPLTTIKNPAFTLTNGMLNINLSPGRYKAEASAFGYDVKTVVFTLGPDANQMYPIINLEQNIFNLPGMISYLWATSVDTLMSLLPFLKDLGKSTRFFNSVALFSMLSSISLGYLLFTFRTNINWPNILPFFVFHLALLGKHHKKAYLYGTIVDIQNHPVNAARIDVLDLKTNVVISRTTTNRAGAFHILKLFERPYVKFLITKEGFSEMEMIVPTDKTGAIQVRLVHTKKLKQFSYGFRHTTGEFFEVALLLSFLAELLFLLLFGVAKTLPFFVLSIINLFLWLSYQRNHT